jgi:DNA-binding transcriptional MerR regulator
MSTGAAELAKRADCTARQLDYWTRIGLVHPEGSSTPGSGYRRQYSDEEAEFVILMSRLVRVGFDPDVAAARARAHEPGKPLDIGSGVFLLVEETEAACGSSSSPPS